MIVVKRIKPNKVQLIKNVRQHLKYKRESGHKDVHLEEIMDGIETLNDLKLTLVDYANKFYHIRSQQLNNQVQWYLGDKFNYSPSEIFNYLQAMHMIAQETNYNLYSKQGFWFIKSY